MRKRSNFKRQELQGDSMHNRVDVRRFINYLMVHGRLVTAEKVFYGALDEIKNMKKEDEPLQVFDRAMTNASPLLEVVSKRVGGANYQVPRDVRPERKFFLAAHWIIDAARKRSGSPMQKRLAEEIVAAAQNEGAAIKKKQDMHRMAEANRAFASFIR